jgi:hypothetical protein
VIPEIKRKGRGKKKDEDDGAFVLGQEEGQGPGMPLGPEEISAINLQAVLAFLAAQPLGSGLQLPEKFSSRNAPEGRGRLRGHKFRAGAGGAEKVAPV